MLQDLIVVCIECSKWRASVMTEVRIDEIGKRIEYSAIFSVYDVE